MKYTYIKDHEKVSNPIKKKGLLKLKFNIALQLFMLVVKTSTPLRKYIIKNKCFNI